MSTELADEADTLLAQAMKPTRRCSFCMKALREVKALIKADGVTPKVYICDECVGLCNAILVKRAT